MTETQERNEVNQSQTIERQEISERPSTFRTDCLVHTVYSYNLTEDSPFTPCQHVPPAFIIAEFGQNPLHAYTTGVWCQLDLAALENRRFLVKSHKITVQPEPPGLTPLEKRLLKHPRKIKDPMEEKEPGDDFEKLIFQFGLQSFLCLGGRNLTSYATTPEEAEKTALSFIEKYKRPPKLRHGSYVLIKYQKDEIDTHSVRLKSSMRIAEDQLDTLYGAGCLAWHQQFTELLHTRTNGISIFEGNPGTGKTSYIRHLMSELEETHRFYFIPTINLDMLSRPDFIDFWTRQRRVFPEFQFVVILEDAENALMTRGTDNACMVSAILNLTDGMLADFLHLQFICTINCKIAEIDSALLRPGRLLSHRNFRKLTRSEAQTLAQSIGKVLPDYQDYTLAEIYAQPALDDNHTSATRSKIGFGIH